MNDLTAGATLIRESDCATEGVCRLTLIIDDPLIVPELLAHEAGPQRDEFAITALRIGVLALKQAQGRLDADVIRGESDRLLDMLEQRLGSHQRTVQEQVNATLREYFDPKSGRFNERVQQLVGSGGDLERVLQSQVASSDSELAKTLQKALDAQRGAILAEFSLDQQNSAIARMKRELEQLVDKSNRDNTELMTTVRASLAALQARKEESLKSTRHGLEFENAVHAFLAETGRAAGDVVEHTAGTTGLIKSCKVGDVVVTLGPEHAAAGARIAIEAKEDARYKLRDALAEIEVARKNRNAAVGVFVFSKRTADETIAPLTRYGDDIVMVWDHEDASTDMILGAALSLARALCVRAGAERKQIDVDLVRMQRAMLDVEKQVQGMDDIRRNAQSIRSCADKIEERARLVSDNILRATRILNEETGAIEAALAES